MSGRNKKRNTNNKIVVIRKDRKCACCSDIIPAKTKALTVSSKTYGRVWYCLGCVMKQEERERLLGILGTVSYDDEGAAQYYEDELHKLEDYEVF